MPVAAKVSRLEHLKSAGRKGGLTVLKKYGKLPIQENIRKEKWNEWWNSIGEKAHLKSHAPLKITKPKKSPTLAEFVGIMMGDGTISAYHIGITLNATDDADYAVFVTKLIRKLFGIHPKIYKRKNKNAVAITVARKLLVEHLHSLGLPIGNKIKQGLDIPRWILNNPEFAKACLRGLMDTDGSVFTHTYKAKTKIYRYRKLSFTSASPALLVSVQKVLAQNDIQSSISKTNLRIGSKASINRYLSCISSNNTKHLKRIAE
jgi:intein/homing endonuclease